MFSRRNQLNASLIAFKRNERSIVDQNKIYLLSSNAQVAEKLQTLPFICFGSFVLHSDRHPSGFSAWNGIHQLQYHQVDFPWAAFFLHTTNNNNSQNGDREREQKWADTEQLKTIFNFCFISFSLEWTSTKDAMEVNISEYKVYKMRTKTEAKSRLSKHSIACICVNNAFKKSDCFRFSHSHRHFYLHTFLCTFSTKFK